MGFSMSATTGPYRARMGDMLPVRVWGSDGDGGPDGLPVIVARTRVRMLNDGPEPDVRAFAEDGSGYYRPTEYYWAPLQGEYVISAEWVPTGDSEASREV